MDIVIYTYDQKLLSFALNRRYDIIRCFILIINFR